jgi:hypothetical protein
MVQSVAVVILIEKAARAAGGTTMKKKVEKKQDQKRKLELKKISLVQLTAVTGGQKPTVYT